MQATILVYAYEFLKGGALQHHLRTCHKIHNEQLARHHNDHGDEIIELTLIQKHYLRESWGSMKADCRILCWQRTLYSSNPTSDAYLCGNNGGIDVY